VEATGNGRTLAGLEVLDGRVISRQEIRRVDEGELLGGGDACALFLELVVIHRRHLCKPKKKRWMYILTSEHFRGSNRREGCRSGAPEGYVCGARRSVSQDNARGVICLTAAILGPPPHQVHKGVVHS
jgi:hypothetical protein